MYLCRDKGSEDINLSVNSSDISVVASRLQFPFFFTLLFPLSVYPVYDKVKTMKPSSFGNEVTTIICIITRTVAWAGRMRLKTALSETRKGPAGTAHHAPIASSFPLHCHHCTQPCVRLGAENKSPQSHLPAERVLYTGGMVAAHFKIATC